MVWPGTRYADGDHLGRAMRIDGVRSLAGMAIPDIEIKPEGLWDVYFLAARDPKGIPIYPEKWDDAALKDFERKNNLRYWAQMMNDPAQSAYNPLTRERLLAATIPAKMVPKDLRISFHLDTAFKSIETQARGDESVIVKVGHQVGTGKVYVLGVWGSNLWTMEQFLDRLVEHIRSERQRGSVILGITDEQEPGGKAGTWEYAIRAACHKENVLMPPMYSLVRGARRKMKRLVEAAGLVADEFCYFVQDAPGMDELLNQLAKIGQSEKDDRADAFSDCFNPKVYTPVRRVGDGLLVEEPRYPGDDTLRPLGPSPTELYDRFTQEMEAKKWEIEVV